jgi:hypothetical protein
MGDSQTFWGKDGGEGWAEVDAALDTRAEETQCCDGPAPAPTGERDR